VSMADVTTAALGRDHRSRTCCATRATGPRSLLRRGGASTRAEDAVQEASSRASQQWRTHGVPPIRGAGWSPSPAAPRRRASSVSAPKRREIDLANRRPTDATLARRPVTTRQHRVTTRSRCCSCVAIRPCPRRSQLHSRCARWGASPPADRECILRTEATMGSASVGQQRIRERGVARLPAGDDGHARLSWCCSAVPALQRGLHHLCR